MNAIIGDNGLITQTQYALFLQEMTAVQEAFDTWKAGRSIEDIENSLPVIRLITQTELSDSLRLTGELGYYRVWSITGKKPTQDIRSNISEFDNNFSEEIVAYPSGIQDLYLLNNKILDLDEDKIYYIDAVNSMIYSANGFSIDGIPVHSLSMLKALKNGSDKIPKFATVDVSAGENNEGKVLAGNTEPEYLMNENGEYVDEEGEVVEEANKVKNPNYNPNGFQIISSPNSNNIYKLYNNGDLYGKGIKGSQLNTSPEEMAKNDTTKWTEFTIPSEIGEYKTIIPGSNTMYVIDKNDYLWAWGSNAANKLGLTSEEQKDYNEREAIKLKIGEENKKVYRIFDSLGILYVVTTDNYLYGCGSNNKYQLGLGHNEVVDSFQKIDVENPKDILQIYVPTENWNVLIAYKNHSYLITGERASGIAGMGVNLRYTKFCPVWDGYLYKLEGDNYVKNTNYEYKEICDIDQDINKVINYGALNYLILKNDNTVWMAENDIIKQITGEMGSDVKNIYSNGYGFIIWKNSGEVFGMNWVYDSIGTYGTTRSIKNIVIPDELKNDKIKEIYSVASGDTDGAVFYLSEKNEVWASANSNKCTGGNRAPIGIEKLNMPKIKSFYNVENKVYPVNTEGTMFTYGTNLFLGTDEKLYILGYANVVFRNNILQGSWKKIVSNVKMISIGANNSFAYIEKGTNDVYVAGNDSRMLGLGTESASAVNNFVKITDVAVAGKAKYVHIACGQIYIITDESQNEDENNRKDKLYVSGIFSADGKSTGWPQDRWPGWNELENHYSFIEILDDVKLYGGSYYDKMAVSGNELYVWGGDLLLSSKVNESRSPKLAIKPNDVNATDIEKIEINRNLGVILTKSGNIYLAIQASEKEVKVWDDIQDLFGTEKVIDFCISDGTAIFLTNEKNVYGFGVGKYLGIGDSSNKYYYLSELKKLDVKNIVQITGGKGVFVAIDEKGRVFGTGINSYGILGRWIGVGRGESNSRYKTAFYWVECPELEI